MTILVVMGLRQEKTIQRTAASKGSINTYSRSICWRLTLNTLLKYLNILIYIYNETLNEAVTRPYSVIVYFLEKRLDTLIAKNYYMNILHSHSKI